LEDNQVNIVLFGPPGAGKGTQANNLVKNFNLHKISTGDLLRNEVINKTELGLKIKSFMDNGQLVSDEIIKDLIEKIIKNKDFFNRMIFDGYPRNLEQAKSLYDLLNENNQKIFCVLNLNVDRNSIIKRILGRETCVKCGLIFNKYFNPATKENHSCDPKFLEKRSDDNKDVIVNRFETYIKKTLPILNYYANQKLLHEINGLREMNQIYEEIHHIITSLEA
jgi:adenylate kinase